MRITLIDEKTEDEQAKLNNSPVEPLPLPGQASRSDKLVKSDASSSSVPDLKQRHVVPAVATGGGERPELLVPQDHVHLRSGRYSYSLVRWPQYLCWSLSKYKRNQSL